MRTPAISRGWLQEVVIVVLLAVLTCSISWWYCGRERARGTIPRFYQSYYEPAVRMACGQPFGVDASGQMPPEMKRFLELETQTLPFEAVNVPATVDTHPATRAWYYLFVSTATVWKITGITWRALDGFAAVLLAIASVWIYLLFRLVMPAPTAFLLSFLATLPGLPYLLFFRDLNKAPFILAGIFVSAWLVLRTPTRARLFLAVAAIGTWLGIGYGFRPDVLIALPLLTVTLLFFRPAPLRKGWLERILLVTVLLGFFAVTASPAMPRRGSNVGTAHWHFTLLGLSDSHTELLGVTPADYSWLSHYMDDLVGRTVDSYAVRALRQTGTGYYTPMYDQVSRTLYLQIVRTFVGDFMTRSLAASQRVLCCGLRVPRLHGLWTPGFVERNQASLTNILMLGWLAIVLAALAWDLRVGLFTLFALAYLLAYPAVQFDFRHYFQLAFLTWLPVGIALGWASRGSRDLRAWLRGRLDDDSRALCLPTPEGWSRGVVVLTVFAVLGCGVYLGGRHWQVGQARALFHCYLTATGTTATIASETPRPDGVLLTMSPPWSVETAGADGSPSAVSGVGARMLRLDLEDASPSTEALPVRVSTEGSGPGQTLKKEILVRLGPSRPSASLFIPVYFSPAQATLLVDLPRRNLLTRATWLRSDTLPALWLWAALYPDGQPSKLYQECPLQVASVREPGNRLAMLLATPLAMLIWYPLLCGWLDEKRAQQSMALLLVAPVLVLVLPGLITNSFLGPFAVPYMPLQMALIGVGVSMLLRGAPLWSTALVVVVGSVFHPEYTLFTLALMGLLRPSWFDEAGMAGRAAKVAWIALPVLLAAALVSSTLSASPLDLRPLAGPLVFLAGLALAQRPLGQGRAERLAPLAAAGALVIGTFLVLPFAAWPWICLVLAGMAGWSRSLTGLGAGPGTQSRPGSPGPDPCPEQASLR